MTKPAINGLLLDMNGTFMFGEDRFGPSEDFFATYKAIGGERLEGAAVDQTVRGTLEALSADYADPSKRDDFPSVAEALRRQAGVPEPGSRDCRSRDRSRAG